MAGTQTIAFSDIRVNGQSIHDKFEATLKECHISQLEGRYWLRIRITDEIFLELDIQKSLAELKHSKWDVDTEIEPIVNFTFSLASIPTWLAKYTSSPKGCLQWVYLTLKMKESRSNYLAFVRTLVSMLSPPQWKIMDHDEALALWAERCAPLVTAVRALNIRPPNFQPFSLTDLGRLKNNDKWLTDTHVTFSLLDSYQKYSLQNIWGNHQITVLDTIFWSKMSADPDAYHDRYRAKVNLVGYDFVVMPMFGNDHWRLGIVEKPGELLQGNTIFHILDSLPTGNLGRREATQLQNILLKHFEGAAFEQGRITINLAQVPRQTNSNDCGCFLIYFADNFFSNPEWTMARIKDSFSSPVATLAAWGLETNDLSFVRTEMRALLFKYIKQGDAIVEYASSSTLAFSE